jgi:hypothetical protein
MIFMRVPTNETELKETQIAIDEMVANFEFYKKEVEKLGNLVDANLKVNAGLQIAIDNLMTTIKNIHIVLNEDNAEKIEEMRRELGKFILSGEAIKSGVRENANH